MKIKIIVIFVLFVSILFGQDRRKVGLIPVTNESTAKFDWVSYGLEYLLYNKLSVISGFYVMEKDKFKQSLQALNYKSTGVSERLIFQLGRETGVQVVISGRFRMAANTISLEIVYSNAFNGTEILNTQYQEPLENLFTISSRIVDQLINLAGINISDRERSLLGFTITNSVTAFESFVRAYMEEETKTGRREAVIGLFQRAVREDPNFWEAYYNLGIVYFNAGRYNQALEQFNKVISALPNFDKPYYGRGLIYEEQGKYKEAIADFKRVTEFNPNDFKPFYYLGKLSLKDKNYKEAEEFLNKSIQLNPEFAPAFYEIGNIHYSQNNFRRAINFYKTASELDASNEQYFLILADTYYRSNIYFSALEAVNRSIAIKPGNALAYFLLGITVYKQAVMEELIEAFLDLLAEDKSSDVLVADTNFEFKKKSAAIDPVKKRTVYEQMADAFNKAVTYKPDFMEATFNLALTYHEMGEFNLAERYYKAALQLKPDLIRAYMKLADLYTETRRNAEAIDQYRKVFAIEPGLILKQQNLGKEHNYVNVYNQFRKELDDKLQLNPNDPRNNLILAKIFKAQGNFGKAANLLRSVLTQNPNNSEAKNLLESIQRYGS